MTHVKATIVFAQLFVIREILLMSFNPAQKYAPPAFGDISYYYDRKMTDRNFTKRFVASVYELKKEGAATGRTPL